MPHAAQISDPSDVRRFATAGKARFTLVSEKTGIRFTYQVRLKKGSEDFFFVSVLTGSQNTRDYTYLGCLRAGSFIGDRQERISASAPSRQAFAWFWNRVKHNQDLSQAECWHEGKCGRCGRALTVPESIQSGLGPVCAGRVG